jgi:hypothetical protein
MLNLKFSALEQNSASAFALQSIFIVWFIAEHRAKSLPAIEPGEYEGAFT